MVSSTRSGRILEHQSSSSTSRSGRLLGPESSSSTKRESASVKPKNVKISPIAYSNSNNAKNQIVKSTAVSTTNSSKTSERRENNDNKSERLEKKRPHSSLRRSLRITNNVYSGSRDLKKVEESDDSIPVLKKRKASTDSQSKDNNKDSEVYESKPRLGTQRNSTSLLLGNDEFSDDGNTSSKDDCALKGNNSRSPSIKSNVMHDGLDDTNGKKETELPKKLALENGNKTADGFRYSGDKKRKSDWLRENENIEKSLTSKCMDISSQSSQVGLTTEDTGYNKIQGVDNMCSTDEQLEASRLVASPTLFGDSTKDSKDAMSVGDLDMDNSVRAANENICSTDVLKEGITSSLPCNSTSKVIKRCACCKQLKRVDNISEAHELCSCHAQREHNLIPCIIGEPSEPVSRLGENEAPATYSQGNNYNGYLVPEVSKHSPVFDNTLKYDPNDDSTVLSTLKEKLDCHLACEKTYSPKFLEYWVPVRLSNVQLEQYCSTLVSNLNTLRSSSRVDQVDALRGILIATRKCCDHPYLADENLQISLTKDLPVTNFLDVGVKASGKLYLLDMFLHEIKSEGLRVLILFQSIGGTARDSIGNILDDFMRQRFGEDSYERVDCGLILSKKLAALNKFNDKTMGRFVFLLETRACLSSVKLSSVDAIIMFNSNWNPSNDLRALQRIQIDSESENIKVFRLYSSCTIEEKVLILSKQDVILDSNFQNISPNNCHLLLNWGANYLFRKLDEFHHHDTEMCFLNDSLLIFFKDIILELVKQLPGKVDHDSRCALLIKAQQSGASYSKSIILTGEREGLCTPCNDFPSFWSGLLEKIYPTWRFISEPTQRVRRKAQHFVDSLNEAGLKNKKQREFISVNSLPEEKIEGTCKNAKLHGDISTASNSSSATPAFLSNTSKEPETYIGQSNTESERKHKSQKALHLCLKPELSQLCDTLKLPGDVKDYAHALLEHTMSNHHVNPEPATILQAFKLSLCWRAAYFLKHKVDQKGGLARAKEYLNYTCNQEEVDSVYSKLRMLKKKFSLPGAVMQENNPDSVKNLSSVTENSGLLTDTVLKKRIDMIDIICSERKEALLLKQQAELKELNAHGEEVKMMLKNAHDNQLEIIRSTQNDDDYTMRYEKIKLLNKKLSSKMTDFDKYMKSQCQKLAVIHENANNKEQKIRDRWLEEAEAGILEESFDSLPLTETGFKLEKFYDAEELVKALDCFRSIIPETNLDNMLEVESAELIETPQIPTTILTKVNCDGAKESEIPFSESDVLVMPLQTNERSAEILETIPHNMVDTESVEPNGMTSLAHGTETQAFESNNMLEVDSIEPNSIDKGTNFSQSTALPTHNPYLATEVHVLQEGVDCSTSQTEVPIRQVEQSNPLVITNAIGSQESRTCFFGRLQMGALVHPQALHPDPLQNELLRIQKHVEIHTKMHEDKKRKRNLECEQEIEKVRKKYAALVQKNELEFQHGKEILQTIYNKVLVNQIFAKEFKAKFIDAKKKTFYSQGNSPTSMQNSNQTSQAPPVPVLANQPQISNPAHNSIHDNIRSQLSSNMAQNGNYINSPASCTPAPHLPRFGSPYIRNMRFPPGFNRIQNPPSPFPNLGNATSQEW